MTSIAVVDHNDEPCVSDIDLAVRLGIEDISTFRSSVVAPALVKLSQFTLDAKKYNPMHNYLNEVEAVEIAIAARTEHSAVMVAELIYTFNDEKIKAESIFIENIKDKLDDYNCGRGENSVWRSYGILNRRR